MLLTEARGSAAFRRAANSSPSTNRTMGPGTGRWSPRVIGWCASAWPPGWLRVATRSSQRSTPCTLPPATYATPTGRRSSPSTRRSSLSARRRADGLSEVHWLLDRRAVAYFHLGDQFELLLLDSDGSGQLGVVVQGEFSRGNVFRSWCRPERTWPRKSARLVGYVSRTCSRASWWNPAAANALHVSSRVGKVLAVRAVSGNHRTSSIVSCLRFPEGSYLSGKPCRMRTGAPGRRTRRISCAATSRSGTW